MSNLLANILTTQALEILSQDANLIEDISKEVVDTFAQVLSKGQTGQELDIVQKFQSLYKLKHGYPSYSLEMAESYVKKHMQRGAQS